MDFVADAPDAVWQSQSLSSAAGKVHLVVDPPVVHRVFAVDNEVHLAPGIPVVVVLKKLPAVAGNELCPVLCTELALSPSTQQFR